MTSLISVSKNVLLWHILVFIENVSNNNCSICTNERCFNSLYYISFQIFTVLAPAITEEAPVILKQNGVCIVEASDDVPRQIDNCPHEQGEQIIITYKRRAASDRKPQTYLEA